MMRSLPLLSSLVDGCGGVHEGLLGGHPDRVDRNRGHPVGDGRSAVAHRPGGEAEVTARGRRTRDLEVAPAADRRGGEAGRFQELPPGHPGPVQPGVRGQGLIGASGGPGRLIGARSCRIHGSRKSQGIGALSSVG